MVKCSCKKYSLDVKFLFFLFLCCYLFWTWTDGLFIVSLISPLVAAPKYCVNILFVVVPNILFFIKLFCPLYVAITFEYGIWFLSRLRSLLHFSKVPLPRSKVKKQLPWIVILTSFLGLHRQKAVELFPLRQHRLLFKQLLFPSVFQLIICRVCQVLQHSFKVQVLVEVLWKTQVPLVLHLP